MLDDYYVATHLVTANLRVGDVVDIIGTLTSLKRLSLQANRFQGASSFRLRLLFVRLEPSHIEFEFNTLRCAPAKD
jgi:hypothetical protein